MEIRQCTAQDIGALGEFYDEVVLYLVQHINYPQWMYKSYPSKQSAAEAVAEGSQYACFDNGEIVGAFVFNTDPKGSYAKVKWSKQIDEGNYLVIHSLATKPQCYRRGIAQQMLDFCINYAKEQHFPAIRLDVVPGNFPAMEFYCKNGFKFVEEVDLDRNFEHIPTFRLFELNF